MEKKQKFLYPLIFISILSSFLLLFLISKELSKDNFLFEKEKIEKINAEKEVKERTESDASLLLSKGKQVYEIISDKENDPQIMEVEVAPLDVELGKEQLVTVKVITLADEITFEDEVLGEGITDSKTFPFKLKLKKAEGDKELITTWQGTWKREDSIEKNYQLKILAKTKKSEDQIVLSFLPLSCSNVPPGGDYTVSENCAFSGTVNGVDNGNLTIATGYTLTINAGQTIVWNPGKSVVINGSLAINKPGGTLKKTYLWMLDADNDNYVASATQVAADASPGSGYKRRYLFSSIATTDCCDSDANAKPGQTLFFSTARSGCGGYDFDCDGTELRSSSGNSGAGAASH